jgi:hypothetical protein
VTSEMALAVIAIIGAGLFLASFRHVSEIRTGFESDYIAIAQLDLSAASYSASQAEFFSQRFTVNLERQPGVTAVAYADYVSLSVVQGSWEDLVQEWRLDGACTDGESGSVSWASFRTPRFTVPPKGPRRISMSP